MLLACAVAASSGPLAGQQVIELTGEDRILDAGFEELYRVGSLHGGDWDTFGSVAAVAFDGAGNLYILDYQASRVSVVDLTGSLVRHIGREGEGPGEFTAGGVWAFTVLADGRAVVFDANQRVYKVFDSGGSFDRMIRLSGDAMFYSIPALQAERDADAVLATGLVETLSMPGSVSTPEPAFRPIERYVLSGEEVVPDTLAEAWKVPGNPMGFAPRLAVGVLPGGGVAFTDSSAYAIKVTTSSGDVVRVLRRPFHPEPVTERVRAAEIERQLEEVGAEAIRPGRAGRLRGKRRVGRSNGGGEAPAGRGQVAPYQIRRTPYRSKSDSIDTSGKSCASDCAINMRSNGSRCGPGSLPARSACATVIARG